MSKVKFNGSELFINDNVVDFQENILQAEEDDNRIYVLLDIPTQKRLVFNDYHNIYCCSKQGEVIWQIGKRPQSDDAVYTMISFDGEYLYANDFYGRRYTVDKNNGVIIDVRIAK